MREKETEELIYQTVDSLAEQLVSSLPPGVLGEAIRSSLTGPARLAGRFDAKLRELIPWVPTQEIPVLEGTVVEEPRSLE